MPSEENFEMVDANISDLQHRELRQSGLSEFDPIPPLFPDILLLHVQRRKKLPCNFSHGISHLSLTILNV